LDGAVLYRWAKPAGSLYQELRRILTEQLGAEWGPDRNGTREMVGFAPAQLRRCSKRTSQIEAYLERSGGVYQPAVERMRADHLASLATRPDKDRSLTSERLRDRWTEEATDVDLDRAKVEAAVLGRATRPTPLTFDEVVDALVGPETGLCANDSRFGEAQVVERVAALGGGRLPGERYSRPSPLSSSHPSRRAPQRGTGRRGAHPAALDRRRSPGAGAPGP